MAAHIQFDDDYELKKPPTNNNGEGTSSAALNGIYNIRNLSVDAASRRNSFMSRTNTRDRNEADEEAEAVDDAVGNDNDFKRKQVFSRKQLFLLAYQSIGVIYGDIGTSPLYVYSSTFSAPPSNEDLVGALSLIIWALTMMVTVKYIIIILRADNEGEGGTFSTYSLISRYANITQRDPREASLVRIERYKTGDFNRSNRAFRSFLENSKVMKAVLKVMGVLAVTMVLSDGVLTPAQSVLGAVQGLDVIAPNITNGTVVGTTCGILVLLFLIQPFGTTKIAVCFAPIVIVWLAFNAAFGIYNLAEYDWTVLRAFNPGYAFKFLIRNQEPGWRRLGGILLAFTGVEALFADLGAFSANAIRISWLCYTFPCLLLAYIGQAAYISVFPEAYSNPFFNAAPTGTLIPSLILAILAAIVASQAIITATFQLLTQIMKLSYFPQVKVVHTSRKYHGQIYVPFANWLLMIGTVLITAIFNNTTSLGNAYGVCVMFVTFFDTCMVTLTAILVWQISPFIVFLPWLTIASLDGTFMSSALTKVPDGAWFTISLATLLASILILWRFGKESQWRAEASDRFPTNHLVTRGRDGALQLTEQFNGGVLSVIDGFGVFFDKAGEKTPIVFTHFLSKLMAIPKVTVFFHLRPLETPVVPPEDRWTVSRMSIPNCYRVVVRHGFMDEVISPNLSALLYEQVRAFIINNNRPRTAAVPHSEKDATVIEGLAEPVAVSQNASEASSNGSVEKAPGISASAPGEETRGRRSDREEGIVSPTMAGTNEYAGSEQMRSELARLESAFARQSLYIVGKEELHVGPRINFFKRIFLGAFLWMRDNTRPKIANLRVPSDKTIEVGFVKEL